jgi:hypothetical protein
VGRHIAHWLFDRELDVAFLSLVCLLKWLCTAVEFIKVVSGRIACNLYRALGGRMSSCKDRAGRKTLMNEVKIGPVHGGGIAMICDCCPCWYSDARRVRQAFPSRPASALASALARRFVSYERGYAGWWACRTALIGQSSYTADCCVISIGV